MRQNTGRRSGGSSSMWWRVLRRVWPLGALLAAGLAVTASPSLHALLVALIWASWSLVAVLCLHALGLRVPAPWKAGLRRRGRRFAALALVGAGRLSGAAGSSCAAARDAAVVQLRRLRARRQERLLQRATQKGDQR